MGLLLLLTSALLSSYLHPGRGVDAQRLFTIRGISLSIEPRPDVTRDTNVTLRCQAVVSSSGHEVLSREYTIFKDGNVIYTKTSSSSEDLLYPLPEARVSNSGKYVCSINIEGKQSTSEAKKLTVTGLSKPILHLNKGVVSEGEELTARCTAPGETGSIYFYFYEDSKEIREQQVRTNHAEVELRLRSVGYHKIHCTYTVLVSPSSFKSDESNSVTVSVKELSIQPVLEIFPRSKIYEGDQLFITCMVASTMRSYDEMHLYLSQGTKLLSSGDTMINHSMVALTMDPGEFECRFDMGKIAKATTKKVTVTELFSVPTLTMSPAEVFQKDMMTLTCRSESFAAERLRREELTYTLEPLTDRGNGVFTARAMQNEFNYTCEAQARGIVKQSKPLTVRPKAHVTGPKISVIGTPILGQKIRILCKSDNGSFPINYTLYKEYTPVDMITVRHHLQDALFTITITDQEELNRYMCEAKNSRKDGETSRRLKATVTVPLSNPTLTVIPDLQEISEGNHLYLICGISGTPPVTFTWYREGNTLNSTYIDKNNTAYQIPVLSKKDSGKYYCEASNKANRVYSEAVHIEVRLALWKKALIGGVCLLAVSVLVVLVLVLCFRSKRGKREAAAELSVKPSSPKSDDSLTVTLTRGTEVYNAATGRVDMAAVSVWSKGPPETGDDEESSVASNEPDVEYTEVVHPRALDPDRVPLRKGTDTVYSELQNSPDGAAGHHDYGSVQYAELNGEQPDINHYRPDNFQDLPEPVD